MLEGLGTTGAKEVWWFKAYDSVANKNLVVDAWAKNKVTVMALPRN